MTKAFVEPVTVGELKALDVHHPRFYARVFLQGAHLTHFMPKGQDNWLWLSDDARYQKGASIRGGIPVCWPWFGVPERNPEAVRTLIRCERAHGFVRTREWVCEAIRESAASVTIALAYQTNDADAALYAGQLGARVTFTLSEQALAVSLETTNHGQRPVCLSQALHTYLPTRAIQSTRVQGLQGRRYIDTLRGWRSFLQQGPVTFSGETDRIYEHGGPLWIYGPEQWLLLDAEGSNSTVVWNPWSAKAARMGDLGPSGWQRMLCVETANAAADARTLAPGERHSLALHLRGQQQDGR